MRCLSSRRLTGPNLLWSRPGAVLDVELGEVAPAVAIEAWRTQIGQMLDAVSWEREQTCVRHLSGGASLAISAPMDGLYSATEINDWAWKTVCHQLVEGSPPPLEFEPAAAHFRGQIAQESNPRLQALAREAERNGCTLLLDPDECSIGMGVTCQRWDPDELPEPGALDWTTFADVPLVLITGTNGKTTSARLMAGIASAAGLRPGMSSTDGIFIDGELLETGDYSGPGGARAVLRHSQTQFAVLETARGGLLRRGLGVNRADGALITNIAADHMGQFGVNTLEELADVKWIVSRALGGDAPLVLNAEDPLLVERGLSSELRIIWYAMEPTHALLQQHVDLGGTVCTVLDGDFTMLSQDVVHRLLPVTDLALSHGGRARHNVMNALGVIGLAKAIGLPDEAIVAGICAGTEAAHPGRSNLFEVAGANVLVDYAHNPHGLDAILDFAGQFDARRRLLLIGHAGDRRDEDLRELVHCTRNLRFDHIIIKTLESFRRGREPGAVEAILRDEFLAEGFPEHRLELVESEMAAVQRALEWAEPGDFLVLLVHEAKQEVINFISDRIN